MASYTSEQYHPLAKAFHWGVAAFVFVVWPLGAVSEFVKDDVKSTFLLWHESLGFVVLWLMLARLCVRFLTETPSKPPMPGWQKVVATISQWGLYLALIVQPVSGFLMANAHGYPLKWFGLVPVWSPIGKSEDLAPILSGVHYWSSWTILGLVLLHVAGALHHRLLRHDTTLDRML